jgi:hypothetical protein
VYGWRQDRATVKLFVNDRLEGETNEILALTSGEGPVSMSSLNTEDALPFIGTIEDIGFYSLDVNQVP